MLWAFGDHLGTLRDLATFNASTDDTAVANHRRYDSYGKLISETNSAVDEIFGFTGRPLDESTGLQNNVNRWFDSTTGRWISEDPIGFDGDSSNLARYVYNSPARDIDPDGLDLPYDHLLNRRIEVCVYDGKDPGTGRKTSKGKHFKGTAGQFDYQIDVSGWEDAIAKLEIFVKKHGKIGRVIIADHGGGQGQELGTAIITEQQFERLRELLAPNASILLTGCSVGSNGKYCQAVANASGATVSATSDQCYHPYAANPWRTYVLQEWHWWYPESEVNSRLPTSNSPPIIKPNKVPRPSGEKY